MGIVGNLRTMQLEELLQWLSQSKKTGTLEINSGRVEKKVFFKDGLILSSASNKPEEYLGHFLVSHGLIDDHQLTKAIELQEKSKMLLGMILVNHGALQEKDLHRMLRLKAEESIYDIFAWQEGDFQFLDDVLPESALVPMRLDVTAIVMEGVQRVDEWRRIRKVIPNEDLIPVSLTDLTKLPDVSPGDKRILETVDDQATIEEIRQSTHSSEYQVAKVLFDQYEAGRVKLIKPRWGKAPDTGAGAGASGGPSSNGTINATALVEAGRTYLGRADYDGALRHLRAARSLEPDNPDAQNTLTQAEKLIRGVIEKAGISPTSIPQLSASMEQLTASNLSPHEGFMLTRINGSYDIQSILKITPMPQLDALMVFWKLKEAGYIRLSMPQPRPAR
jgi:hypothetical protein